MPEGTAAPSAGMEVDEVVEVHPGDALVTEIEQQRLALGVCRCGAQLLEKESQDGTVKVCQGCEREPSDCICAFQVAKRHKSGRLLLQ